MNVLKSSNIGFEYDFLTQIIKGTKIISSGGFPHIESEPQANSFYKKDLHINAYLRN